MRVCSAPTWAPIHQLQRSARSRPRIASASPCHPLKAYNALSLLLKFSHFTANKVILQALQGEDRVDTIDLGIMQGLPWPGLFHRRTSRPCRLVSLLVTRLGASLGLTSYHQARRLA